MAFKKGDRCGRMFSSTYQPKNRGGKRNRFAKMKADIENYLGCKISEVDVNTICAFAAFASREMQRPLVMDGRGKVNEDTPVAIVNLIMALQRQTEQGRTDTLMAIFDRLYGQARQDVEATVTTSLDLSALSDEELLQYNALLEKIKNGKDGKDK